MAEPLHWQRLHLSAPVDPDHAGAALVALASLPGSPRIVLETISQRGRVTWRVGARVEQASDIARALTTHLPDARIAPDTTVELQPVTAAKVRARGVDRLPLHNDAVEAVTRSVLAAMARTRRGEELRLQVVLGPRLRPRTIRDVDPIDRRAVLTKLAEHGFGCAIRIAATAQSPDRAAGLIRSLGSAWHALDAPGVHLSLHQAFTGSVTRATSPWVWPLQLRISDLVPLLGWPTAPPPLAGVPSPHPRILPPHRATPVGGRVLGRSVTEPQRPVALTVEDSLRHLHVLGPSGVGKSTLLASLALQDISAGRAVVVIDPKGDLVTDIARRVPADRLDDLVILDPTQDAVVGINGLAASTSPDLAADVLLGVFHSLYANSWGPRTHDILHASLLTLARRGDGSLPMIPLLLTNPGFRRSIIGRVVRNDPMGLGGFWAWYDALSESERHQAIAPLMNKLRPILLRPGLRAVLGQRNPRFQLADIFTPAAGTDTKQTEPESSGQGKILLISLAKGALGPEASRLLGSLAVALIWQQALARVTTPAAKRTPVTVMVDEVQDYLHLGTTSDLADSLAQARGLGVGFTLAHQHLGQLPTSMRTDVMANARSRVAFTLSPDDARTIAGTTSSTLTPEDFRALPAFHAYAHLLSGGETLPPVSIRTTALDRPIRTMRSALKASTARYAQPLDTIEAELLALAGYPTSTGTSTATDKDTPADDERTNSTGSPATQPSTGRAATEHRPQRPGRVRTRPNVSQVTPDGPTPTPTADAPHDPIAPDQPADEAGGQS